MTQPDALPLPARGPASPLLRRRLFFLILALALVRGLLYVAIFPPWQHYDEPTHFEYVRLIAERGRLPRPGDYDLEMRREIAASMQAAGFWKDMGQPQLDFWSDTPPDIGISELGDPPLYYALLALPQFLIRYQEVETELYLARLGSVLLYLVLVATAYGLVGELFPRRQWLPLVVAAFLVLLPPLTDLMSSVNNDVGAAVAASLLLWAGVRLARRGPSPRRIGAVLLLAIVCVLTKNTAALAAGAVVVALAIGYVPRQQRRWLWLSLAVLVPLLVVAVFSWGGTAAHWLSSDQPSAPNRVQVETPLGRSALALAADGSSHPRAVLQELPLEQGQSLRGHTVTFGAWVRAAEGAEGTFGLRLDDGFDGAWHRVQATSDWQFQAFTATLRTDIPGLAAYAFLPNREDAARQVYVDGLLLVDGEMPVKQPPSLEGFTAEKAQWGAVPVTNLLKNGSAEANWPQLRTWIGDKTLYRHPLPYIFYSLWDWSRTRWIYPLELSILLRSFWGGFGWNHLSLPTPYFYLLGTASGLGLIGFALWLVRRLRSGAEFAPWQRRAWAMMVVAFLAAWASTLLRIHPFVITWRLYYPVSRYAAVVIIPTATILCVGLAEILPGRWRQGAAWLGLLSLLALDTIAIWTVILPYYYG